MMNYGLYYALALLLLYDVESFEQYTPEEAEWTTFYSKAVDNNVKNTDHSPDGIGWIEPEKWLPWDGTTVYNPTAHSKEEFA